MQFIEIRSALGLAVCTVVSWLVLMEPAWAAENTSQQQHGEAQASSSLQLPWMNDAFAAIQAASNAIGFIPAFAAAAALSMAILGLIYGSVRLFLGYGPDAAARFCRRHAFAGAACFGPGLSVYFLGATNLGPMLLVFCIAVHIVSTLVTTLQALGARGIIPSAIGLVATAATFPVLFFLAVLFAFILLVALLILFMRLIFTGQTHYVQPGDTIIVTRD